MFWEEKIDRIKKQFAPADFRVPFTHGSAILKKMETRFAVSGKPAYQRTDWAVGLKDQVVLATIERRQVVKVISQLDANVNYWIVIVLGEASMAERFVYDCKPSALERLIAIAPGSLFIGDKKYAWLVYFDVDSERNLISLFKTKDNATPFDTLQG